MKKDCWATENELSTVIKQYEAVVKQNRELQQGLIALKIDNGKLYLALDRAKEKIDRMLRQSPIYPTRNSLQEVLTVIEHGIKPPRVLARDDV